MVIAPSSFMKIFILGVAMFVFGFVVISVSTYIKDSSHISRLKEYKRLLENQSIHVEGTTQYPKDCQRTLQSENANIAITINCSQQSYCICVSLTSAFSKANASTSQCAASHLDEKSKYYCVSNKPGGQR